MRTVYLIRHAHPDYPLGQRTCLGRTDTPLGPLGRMQAVLLGEELKSAGIESVFSSPLTRCLETAAALGCPIDAVPELAEQDMGLWDGLSFDEIKEHWPELYERREHDSLLVPLGAETLQQVRERVLPAFVACLWRSKGTTAVVAHASVIQTILAELLETPLAESRSLRPPCSAYAVLEQGKSLRCIEMARVPRAAMDRRLAAKLLEASGVPEPVQRHARAVAAEAQR
ncbi:MAG: histidine phosphatase family protein, partial [Oscillospiraceae bacterium]|nr:histidine phosphatase family protein [Oscillospiraceae bacterium]